jgi:hypothetical protein
MIYQLLIQKGMDEGIINQFKIYFQVEIEHLEEPNKDAIISFLENHGIHNLSSEINKIYEENSQFNRLLTDYILIQGMQIGLYGYSTYLYEIKPFCNHLVNILTFLDAEKEYNPCHPYVEWTLMANTLRMFCTLKKECDIPLIFWMKYDINHKIIPRMYYDPSLTSYGRRAKFIGILRIPFYTTNEIINQIDLHYFNLFLFQYKPREGHNLSDSRIVKNRIDQTSSNIIILNKNRMRVEPGTLFPNPSVTYDEFKILYYLSNLPPDSLELKCYLYHDPMIEKTIMISLKDNLMEKYTHLQRVVMEIVEDNGGKKKLIAKNSENRNIIKISIEY